MQPPENLSGILFTEISYSEILVIHLHNYLKLIIFLNRESEKIGMSHCQYPHQTFSCHPLHGGTKYFWSREDH